MVSLQLNEELLDIDTKLSHSVFQKLCTNTTLFLLYMIGYKPGNLPINFVNAYIEDEDYNEDFECPIFMLFRLDLKYSHRDRVWSSFENNMLKNPMFRDKYYVGKEDGLDLVMFVFETPEVFKEDYALFLQGKYSQFSTKFKEVFPKTHIINNQLIPVLHYQVIEKDSNLKGVVETIIGESLADDAELWPMPDIYGREVFKRNYKV